MNRTRTINKTLNVDHLNQYQSMKEKNDSTRICHAGGIHPHPKRPGHCYSKFTRQDETLSNHIGALNDITSGTLEPCSRCGLVFRDARYTVRGSYWPFSVFLEIFRNGGDQDVSDKFTGRLFQLCREWVGDWRLIWFRILR